MRVLVTGGAGFIGSVTVCRLLGEGHDVVVADNFCNSSPAALEKIKKAAGRDFEFVKCDIRDSGALEKAFAGGAIDVVIHFAGLKAVGESVEKPVEYYDNNISGTITLLKKMREHGCGKIVFSSSATVYGAGNQAPFNETMPTSATNPYGYTKLFIERILTDLCTADKEASVVLLRYFNPIGADRSGLLGESPQGIPNNIFPYISRVAKGELAEVRVFGDDYDTPDGTGVRDYIHIEDLARSHVLALDYAARHKGVEAINVGTGKGTSVLELIAAFSRACGKKVPYKIAPRRKGDVATCFASVDKAKTLLGFEAEFDVDRMCEDGWRYIMNQ